MSAAEGVKAINFCLLIFVVWIGAMPVFGDSNLGARLGGVLLMSMAGICAYSLWFPL